MPHENQMPLIPHIVTTPDKKAAEKERQEQGNFIAPEMHAQ